MLPQKNSNNNNNNNLPPTQMTSTCIRCSTQLPKPVVLVCDHQLCLSCAQQVKKAQGAPPLDAKFRIVCTKCHKSTLTHNIENLINQDNDKFLFDHIQSSELNQSSLGQAMYNDPQKQKYTEKQLKQMTYSQRFSNIWAQRKTPDVSQRTSKASNQQKKMYKNNNNPHSNNQNIITQCHIHHQNIMFYCQQQKKVMCMECIYKHTKDYKTHKIYQIKQALTSIQIQNKHFKQQAKKKLDQLDKYLSICKTNKLKLDQANQIHQQLIQKQFKQLQLLIKNKKIQTLQYLETIFQKKINDITLEINDFQYLKNCLKEHYDFKLDNQSSQVYFFNAYSIMRDAINKGTTKIKPFDKQQLTCFDKLCSVSDFKILLQKFLKPKKYQKQIKTHSRGTSENIINQYTNKCKNILYDQYKSAKKNLEKINKIQQQYLFCKDKNFQYLNNYVIDIHHKDNWDDKIPIRQRKSSIGIYASHNDQKKIIHNKALTPTRLLNSKTKKK